MRYILLSVFILCIMPVFLFNIGGRVPPSPSKLMETEGQDYFTQLATCITKNQIKMYGSDSCGNCIRQKKIFGDAFDLIDYTDCSRDENYKICEEFKITSYPTWIQFNDDEEITRHKGVMAAHLLEDFAGCNISKQ